MRYNVAAWGATGVPVYSVLVLLRPKATATDLTSTFSVTGIDGRPYLTFTYTVVRVWRESVESLLSAGIGVAPLALLTDEASRNLDDAFDRFQKRLRTSDVPDTVERGILGSSFVLCGLRYPPEQVESLYRNFAMTFEDSTTYQLILNRGVSQGRAEARDAAVKFVVRLGTKKFGAAPSESQLARLREIAEPDRMELLADRVLDATGWDQLIAVV